MKVQTKLVTTALAALFGISFLGVLAVNAQDETNMKSSYSGGDYTIEETVSNDLYATGDNVEINATVSENVYFVGKNLTLNEKADENFFFVGDTLVVNEKIDENLFFVGDSFFLNGSGSENANGEVGSDMLLVADRVIINGEIDDDVKIIASEVYFGENAEVKGDLDVQTGTVRIHPEVDFDGRVNIEGKSIDQLDSFYTEDIPVDLSSLPSGAEVNMDTLKSMMSLFGIAMLLMGVVGGTIVIKLIFKLFPVKSKSILENLEFSSKNIGPNAKYGSIAILIAILGGFLLLFTFIGIPVFMFLKVLGILAYILGGYLTMYKIGSLIIQKKDAPVWLVAVVGILVSMVVFAIISIIPAVGGLLANLLGFVFVIYALGGVLRVKFENMNLGKKK